MKQTQRVKRFWDGMVKVQALDACIILADGGSIEPDQYYYLKHVELGTPGSDSEYFFDARIFTNAASAWDMIHKIHNELHKHDSWRNRKYRAVNLAVYAKLIANDIKAGWYEPKVLEDLDCLMSSTSYLQNGVFMEGDTLLPKLEA